MIIIIKWKSHGVWNMHFERLGETEIGLQRKLYSCNDGNKNTSCLTNLKTI